MSGPTPEERFATLFDANYPALLGYAVRRVSHPEDAADVVAEAFLVAWRRLDDVPGGADARPWLFGVARNVLANYYRSERRRSTLAVRLRETLTTDPPRAIVEPSTLGAAMALLSEDDRELLRLLAWEGLARDEIALVLRVPRATVRVRLHRARRRLVHLMAEVDDTNRAPAQEALKRSASPGHVTNRRAAGLTEAEEI
ncbi:RNA polymerase sigma factor [Sanguibacter antarcticus]|uniref:RNA polymerase ECF family sigma subunit n=1 Tax=Sanguibacter antarcticus TaxID=372484 RepID=A0A2A9E4C2_9MICO|nr:sigma-70 family RNA polymerase sigma factor [Sanguibacter antarcticus]PFG33029.1 RNA polymerase ECF family sigma subunit [Sanguibacter antarcticus]